VSLPDGEPIYKNPKKPEKWKAHSVIFGKRRKITVKVIDELIKSGADIHADNDYALRWASGHGHKEIVELLIKSGADIHAGNDYALRWAAENGHKEIVELLKGIKNTFSLIVGSLDNEEWKDLKRSIINTGIILYGQYFSASINKNKKYALISWDKIGKNRALS